jgi:hypothetical protein
MTKAIAAASKDYRLKTSSKRSCVRLFQKPGRSIMSNITRNNWRISRRQMLRGSAPPSRPALRHGRVPGL